MLYGGGGGGGVTTQFLVQLTLHHSSQPHSPVCHLIINNLLTEQLSFKR